MFGPIPFAQLRQWAVDAQISPLDKVSNDGRTWIREQDAGFEMNEPDAYALEAALRLKEQHGGEVVFQPDGGAPLKFDTKTFSRVLTVDAHGAVVKRAGQFVRAWGNERFARPKPFESVATATARHDDGWAVWCGA